MFEKCLFCKKCILQKWRQYQFRAVSYRKTCLKMAPNNKLMPEVHSNASQELIFEMAPFPSWYHAKYIFFIDFLDDFHQKNAKNWLFQHKRARKKQQPRQKLYGEKVKVATSFEFRYRISQKIPPPTPLPSVLAKGFSFS